MKATPSATEPVIEPIVVECDLPHPPAQVWRALTEPALLGQWLQDPGRSPIDHQVLEAEPNRKLRWRQTEDGDAGSGWRPVESVVTIELTVRTDGGTHLRLVHDGFRIATGGFGTQTVCQLRRAA